MAAPTHVQFAVTETASATTVNTTLNGVASGNMLYGLIAMVFNGTRSWSLSDDNSNTWNEDVSLEGTSYCRIIGSAANVNSGNTTVTATINAGSGNCALGVGEISGADTTTPFDAGDSNTESSSVSTHNCAASGNIDTVADVYVVAVGGVSVGGASSYTVGSGYTLLSSSTSFGVQGYIMQYQTSASALTDERGQYTTGIARTSKGAVASYKAAAVAGPLMPIFHHRYQSIRARRNLLLGR